MISLWQMTVIREIMKSGSISAAARELGRTQPALSATVKELEKNFISQKDFIVLKFDLFIQKNLNNIFKGGGITSVAYQKIDYK